MPRILDPAFHCNACKYGHCVTYIREQSKKMKDRDTLYRIKQIAGMSCAFEDFIPGFLGTKASGARIIDYAEQVVSNAKLAGAFIEAKKPEIFGDVEAAFTITSGQSGKVRGDVFEMLCRAILWNCAAVARKSNVSRDLEIASVPAALRSVAKGRKIAILTLGDNYDLKKLLDKKSALRLDSFERGLKDKGTSLKYSTPDVICVDTSKFSPSINSYFDETIFDLSSKSQSHLVNARTKIEGLVSPSNIIFAAGIKTSIRSDRMYQFLYEANSWKFLWARAFQIDPSQYFVLTSEIFGADPTKLYSVDFSSVTEGFDNARKAIDGVFHLDTPEALVDWFAERITL